MILHSGVPPQALNADMQEEKRYSDAALRRPASGIKC